MNQIIYKEELEKEKKFFQDKGSSIFIKITFTLSLFILFFFLFYYGFTLYNLHKQEAITQKLSSQFDVSTLYSNNISYEINSSYKNENFSIIGQIHIEKIGLHLPILSHTTDELLKIAPCRFYGPLPNQFGNLCIAGHNYDNNRFFSKLYLLEIGDSILIKDASGKEITYWVYESYEVSASDSSIIAYQPQTSREITLITCNNKNGNRIILKAKE